MGDSCGRLLRGTLVGHSCTTLTRTCLGHSCGKVSLVGRSCWTLLWACGALRRRSPIVSRHSALHETCSKSQVGTPIEAHIKQPCQAVSRLQPSPAPSHANPDSDIHLNSQPHDSLRRLPLTFPHVSSHFARIWNSQYLDGWMLLYLVTSTDYKGQWCRPPTKASLLSHAFTGRRFLKRSGAQASMKPSIEFIM